MAMKTGSLEEWRSYFRTASSDIFDIIDHAIMVAASDCPKEFRMRRDRIAERLFSCKLTRCLGCDRVELAVAGEDDDGGCKSGFDRDGCEFGAGGSKESKVNSSKDDHIEMNVNQVSNYSFGEAEALTDEIEEASQIFEEVLRIKDILHNSEDESDSVLYDCLRKLQLMALNVHTLKETEIGKAVNGFRKHQSKQIRHLARTLIEEWKDLVDEWVSATKALSGTPDSVNPSVVDDEEGLPSPPLDEAFFATQPTAMELSQFFDGMDDDGNPRNGGGFNKNRENGRKPVLKEAKNTVRRKEQHPNEMNVLPKDKGQQMKKHETISQPKKPSNTESGPGRPPKLNMEQRVNNEMKLQKKSDKVAIQKRPSNGQQDKLKSSDDISVQMKLEATKRKLQESYQQFQNAKRQRTIQVMELRDIPKHGSGHKNQHVRSGNHNRHWANGRF